jgi:hypothetical protein
LYLNQHEARHDKSPLNYLSSYREQSFVRSDPHR